MFNQVNLPTLNCSCCCRYYKVPILAYAKKLNLMKLKSGLGPWHTSIIQWSIWSLSTHQATSHRNYITHSGSCRCSVSSSVGQQVATLGVDTTQTDKNIATQNNKHSFIYKATLKY